MMSYKIGCTCRAIQVHMLSASRQPLFVNNKSLSSKFNISMKRLASTYTRPKYDAASFKLNVFKKLFHMSVFSGAVALAWYLHNKREKRLNYIMEDCQKLSLPSYLFCTDLSIYKYKGYVFPGQIVMSGVLKELPNFQFKSDDVIVASYPKTGTTWVQEIVYMLTHDFKKSDSSSEVLETRFPYLEYPYPGIKSVSKMKGPRYIKTHLPYSLIPPSFKESGAKLVYITRNPRDTAVSYYYFMRLLTSCGFRGKVSDFLQMFLSDKAAYSPFFDHVSSYWSQREDPNILFITYEDLQRNPISIIKKIAKFLEIEASDADILNIAKSTTFTAMSENGSVNYEHWKDYGFAYASEGKFLRKGTVGDWEKHFSEAEVKAFEEWERKNLANSDLKFTYSLPKIETMS